VDVLTFDADPDLWQWKKHAGWRDVPDQKSWHFFLLSSHEALWKDYEKTDDEVLVLMSLNTLWHTLWAEIGEQVLALKTESSRMFSDGCVFYRLCPQVFRRWPYHHSPKRLEVGQGVGSCQRCRAWDKGRMACTNWFPHAEHQPALSRCSGDAYLAPHGHASRTRLVRCIPQSA
jgi:hypothetical protein